MSIALVTVGNSNGLVFSSFSVFCATAGLLSSSSRFCIFWSASDGKLGPLSTGNTGTGSSMGMGATELGLVTFTACGLCGKEEDTSYSNSRCICWCSLSSSVSTSISVPSSTPQLVKSFCIFFTASPRFSMLTNN